jgi:hypothetical protein
MNFSLNCSRYQFTWDFWLNLGNWSSYRETTLMLKAVKKSRNMLPPLTTTMEVAWSFDSKFCPWKWHGPLTVNFLSGYMVSQLGSSILQHSSVLWCMHFDNEHKTTFMQCVHFQITCKLNFLIKIKLNTLLVSMVT